MIHLFTKFSGEVYDVGLGKEEGKGVGNIGLVIKKEVLE